jgi:thymidylate kinase
MRSSPIVKICFTGGPCAGKTTAIASCAQQLTQLGIHTYVVPEAATLLNRGGATIANGNLNPALVVKFQINLMKTQIALEDAFSEIANDLHPNDRVVILCDRGVMDGAAYSSGPAWQALLDETGWSNSQLRDKRYDLVLHLVTAADGAEDFYTKANNESRFEDVKEAVNSDKRTQLAWIGHPYFRYFSLIL